MHGRVKVRSTAEQEELKRIERAKKVVQYKAGIDLVIQKRKDRIWDDELFQVIEHMVLKNPDIYTLWNVRREAFSEMNWSEEKYAEELKKELTLTENCLRANPKSYSVWHQRCWVIEHLPEPDWETELSLCSKCLDLDERNFHCWDYRQYIVKKAGVAEAKEFDFSTTKIQTNFSNYSSWHYRSLILPKMFPDATGQLPIRADKHNEELDLVMNATFTDPNDTSAWFYQRWLLDNRKTSTQPFWRALITAHSVLVVFNRDVAVNSNDLSLTIGGVQIDTKWETYNDKKYAKLWTAKFSEQLESLHNDSAVEISYGGNVYKFHCSDESNSWYCTNNSPSIEKYNLSQLTEQLENYKQLAQMEPNNKWALLTGIFLMKNIDPIKFHNTIMEDLSALMKIDSIRLNYYKDLRSQYLIDHALDSILGEGKNTNIWAKVNLSNLGLTILHNEQYFSFFKEVNLSANQLNTSLHRLNALQECVKLSLSSNNIKSLKQFPTLRNLKVLSLRNNDLTSLDDILNLLKHHDLIKLDLRDNPVAKLGDLVKQVSTVSPQTEVLTE